MERTYMTYTHIHKRFLPSLEVLLIFTHKKIIKWCEQRKVGSDM